MEQNDASIWAAHFTACQERKICCFCGKPITEDRLKNGACKECNDNVCLAFNALSGTDIKTRQTLTILKTYDCYLGTRLY